MMISDAQAIIFGTRAVYSHLRNAGFAVARAIRTLAAPNPPAFSHRAGTETGLNWKKNCGLAIILVFPVSRKPSINAPRQSQRKRAV